MDYANFLSGALGLTVMLKNKAENDRVAEDNIWATYNTRN